MVLGRNPPEIAYWERGEWCGVIIAPDGIQAEGKMSSTMQDGLMWRCVACGEFNFNHYENCVSCGRARPQLRDGALSDTPRSAPG